MIKKLLLFSTLFFACLTQAQTHQQAAGGWMSAGTAHSNFTGACTSTATNCNISYTPTSTGNAVWITIGCSCASTTNVIAPTATGWTFTAVACTNGTSCTSGTHGTSGNRIATFWAFAPSTSAATINANWGVSAGGFANEGIDEFSGTDATNPLDAANAHDASGSCSTTVTPTVNNAMLYGYCEDSVTALGAGFSAGGTDTQGDEAEYKSLTGGSGSPQTVNFTGSGTYEMIAITIKPAGGATAPTAPAVVY